MSVNWSDGEDTLSLTCTKLRLPGSRCQTEPGGAAQHGGAGVLRGGHRGAVRPTHAHTETLHRTHRGSHVVSGGTE